jgi:hypothetical protein
MPKYENAVIYKLCCKDPSIKDEYYGHTTNKTKRKQGHKDECYNENRKGHNLPVYQFIRANGGFNNWSMIVVEEYPCENKNQAELRERYWIETQQATLNKNIPTRTSQEYNQEHKEEHKQYYQEHKEERTQYLKQYYQEHKEELVEKQKQYNREHKEEISERSKQYYEENIEEIKEYKKRYRDEHKEELKEKHKQYRDEHKEELKERRKQYYEENREEILEEQKQKNDCECGGGYTNGHKSRHMKTKMHLKYLEDLNKL